MASPESRDALFNRAFDRLVMAALEAPNVPPDEEELAEAGLDSLGLLSLVMSIEDEFGVPWPIENLTSIGRLATVGLLRKTAREIYLGGVAR